MTPQEILNLPMAPNDASAKTVREYIVMISLEVWRHGEGFSGKRPFGNSGWQDELMEPLISAGLVRGDDDGLVVYKDISAADAMIESAILALA